MDQDDMLAFIFMLGTLQLGQSYQTENFTPTQKLMLDDLTDFGIVYRPQEDPSRFYPTRLATTLTSSEPVSILNDSSSLSGQGLGHIILETNYRLYAYTTSPLQIAVLDLFAKLHSRFPNLVSGKLTKSSVQRAISYGITSEQVISYLTANAHPQMRKQNPILPPTVVDQIHLWQIEGDRMQTTEGFLLKEFASAQEYKDTAAYAETLGVLVWKNDNRMAFFASSIDQLQIFLKNRATGTTAAAASKK
jgi:transcription initiation factor TFIIH subunit 4